MTNFEKSLGSGRNKFVIVVVFDYVLVLIMCFFDIFVVLPCISVEAVYTSVLICILQFEAKCFSGSNS